MRNYIILATQLIALFFLGFLLILLPIIRNTSLDTETIVIGSFFLTFGILGVVGFFWKTKVGYMATLSFQYFTTVIFLFPATLGQGNVIVNMLIVAIFVLTVYAVFLLNTESFRKQYGYEKSGFWRNTGAAIVALLMSGSLAIWYHHTDPVLQSLVKVDVIEVRYGLYTSKVVSTANLASSPSGKLTYSDRIDLVERTDTIPAVQGARFGVEYVIRSDTSGLIEVEQAWVFPENIVDADGKRFSETRYKTNKQLNDTLFSFYSLDMDYEIVKGWWSFQLIYDDKRIYERKFLVE